MDRLLPASLMSRCHDDGCREEEYSLRRDAKGKVLLFAFAGYATDDCVPMVYVAISIAYCTIADDARRTKHASA